MDFPVLPGLGEVFELGQPIPVGQEHFIDHLLYL